MLRSLGVCLGLFDPDLVFGFAVEFDGVSGHGRRRSIVWRWKARIETVATLGNSNAGLCGHDPRRPVLGVGELLTFEIKRRQVVGVPPLR